MSLVTTSETKAGSALAKKGTEATKDLQLKLMTSCNHSNIKRYNLEHRNQEQQKKSNTFFFFNQNWSIFYFFCFARSHQMADTMQEIRNWTHFAPLLLFVLVQRELKGPSFLTHGRKERWLCRQQKQETVYIYKEYPPWRRRTPYQFNGSRMRLLKQMARPKSKTVDTSDQMARG